MDSYKLARLKRRIELSKLERRTKEELNEWNNLIQQDGSLHDCLAELIAMVEEKPQKEEYQGF